ncbi:MAG: hormogonium polysaccharide secretion pseudopilin HpsC [Pseudanabaenaceae cyanobacterium SKYGB_i_bin29]|nr:hormogonium polysaccharide secretion pseudopilin HpsC [Pseudanabaenaceae cyanobacterium SKYG29]MDW8421010.1 hormogonium polysaccharide secretion pseudopilin HpsC [Pseudanabaenaceae cyanobacterium SKYGB_i_bin29]
MKQLLWKFILKYLREGRAKISGFTLLELLVASLIAGIMLSGLLAFLVNILQTDQREQAKVQTQEEIQAALDFIADDLKQAVYIYDADGVERSSTDDPPGIRNQLPGVSADRVPILVFWKRHFYDREFVTSIPNRGSCANPSNTSNTCRPIKALPRGTGEGDSVFVYALVAYYLRSNRTGALDRSNAMQIERIEIRDGIRADCQDANPQQNCFQPPFQNRAPIVRQNDVNYWILPDQNFRRFDVSGAGTFRDRMNRWRNAGVGYNIAPNTVNAPQVILDFVDDTFYTGNQDDNNPTSGSIFVPIRPNNVDITVLGGVGANRFFNDNIDCADPAKGVGRNPPNGDIDGNNTLDIATQRIPSSFDPNTNPVRADNASSFFVCVNSVQNAARVYIRGNALARIYNNREVRRIQPVGDRKANFLITASVRVLGRSAIDIQD